MLPNVQPTIRPARATDWTAYRALRMEMLRDAPKAFGVDAAEAATWSDDRWQGLTRSQLLPDCCWYVGLAPEGTWLGQAQGRIIADECWLLEVYVTPALRGSGLATRLVHAVAGWADAQGFRELCLDVGAPQQAARRLYTRLGFEPTGVTGRNAADPSVVELELRTPLPLRVPQGRSV